MPVSEFNDTYFIRFLHLLGIQRQDPGFETLKELVREFMTRIPFENISKLYYRKHLGLTHLIDFELYLKGIEKYHFGGTCYANNYYLNLLLKWLGHEVKLCGADMSDPDIHIVNIVKIKNREYLVDVDYAAPFAEPLPLDLSM